MEQDDPLQSLFERAKTNRVAMATICRRAGVDPTTPSRWKRNKNGATLDKIKQLHAALSEILEAA